MHSCEGMESGISMIYALRVSLRIFSETIGEDVGYTSAVGHLNLVAVDLAKLNNIGVPLLVDFLVTENVCGLLRSRSCLYR